jgi:hypothetical protein
MGMPDPEQFQRMAQSLADRATPESEERQQVEAYGAQM